MSSLVGLTLIALTNASMISFEGETQRGTVKRHTTE